MRDQSVCREGGGIPRGIPRLFRVCASSSGNEMIGRDEIARRSLRALYAWLYEAAIVVQQMALKRHRHRTICVVRRMSPPIRPARSPLEVLTFIPGRAFGPAFFMRPRNHSRAIIGPEWKKLRQNRAAPAGLRDWRPAIYPWHVESEHEIACQHQEDTGEEGVANTGYRLPGHEYVVPIKPME